MFEDDFKTYIQDKEMNLTLGEYIAAKNAFIAAMGIVYRLGTDKIISREINTLVEVIRDLNKENAELKRILTKDRL